MAGELLITGIVWIAYSKRFIFADADVARPCRDAGTDKQACLSGGRRQEKNVYDTVSRQRETNSPGFPIRIGNVPVATGGIQVRT
jgi:hypothetical protein